MPCYQQVVGRRPPAQGGLDCGAVKAHEATAHVQLVCHFVLATEAKGHRLCWPPEVPEQRAGAQAVRAAVRMLRRAWAEQEARKVRVVEVEL